MKYKKAEQRLAIQYMSWQYDLINCNLSFDEIAFMEMMNTFDFVLQAILQEMCEAGSEVRHCHLIKNKMVFRNKYKIVDNVTIPCKY